MQLSTYVSVAAQNNLQRQLEVVANNIANSQTVGFRAESLSFSTLLSRTSGNNTSFPGLGEVHVSHSQGVLSTTGNNLDVALNGPGYFALQTPAGKTYTRDGRFQLDEFGQLVSVLGHPVLDSAETPIVLQTSGQPLEIQQDGRITSGGSIVANLGVFKVDDDAIQSRSENSGFTSRRPGVPIIPGSDTTIVQGSIEQSNVNPLKELTKLIAISRSFEHAAKVIEQSKDAVAGSIREIGNTG